MYCVFHSLNKKNHVFTSSSCMDDTDNGLFEYDYGFLPLCVRPPASQLPMYRKAMETCVIDYLRDSYQHGLKHANTILPSGCSAGEAGVDFFRKRGKVCTRSTSTMRDAQVDLS